MRVALAQMCSGIDPDANLAEIGRFAADARARGADYLQTPEMSVLFAEDRAQLAARTFGPEDNPHIAALADIARTHGLYLHVGSMAVRADADRFFNRSLVFGPDGELLAHYDKIHLFDADVPGAPPYRESATYAPGDRAVLVDLETGDARFKVGLSICFDVRFPGLYQDLRANGATLLAVPAAFTQPTGEAHWEVLLRSRAAETGCYVLAAAQAGSHENGRRTHGHSIVVDPWGHVVAELKNRETGLVVADLTKDAIEKARARLPLLANRRPYSLSINHNAAK